MGKVVDGILPLTEVVDGRDSVSGSDNVVSGKLILGHLQGWVIQCGTFCDEGGGG